MFLDFCFDVWRSRYQNNKIYPWVVWKCTLHGNNWRYKYWGWQWYGSVVHVGFVGWWIHHTLSLSLYAFYSLIGMWNCLVTPSINDREGIDGGGEGISAKDENIGREWFSVAAMKFDGGVEVGLWLCLMACDVKNKEQVRIQGVNARIFSTRLYRKLWEHVA